MQLHVYVCYLQKHGLIEVVMDAATCMCAIFRSMGLIEVVMDAATCICMLSSEA